MGKIIQTYSGKIGHIIGSERDKLLCETLDENLNFIYKDKTDQKELFACDKQVVVKQMGYLNPSKTLIVQ